jgi:hypothetical protein
MRLKSGTIQFDPGEVSITQLSIREVALSGSISSLKFFAAFRRSV